MSTNKLLQSLSDDPQLEKQIGCMAGILQLFDRHQVLTGKRLYGHKRISATASKTQMSTASNCGSPASDTSGLTNETALRRPTEDEKQRHAPATGVAVPPEQQKSQPLPTPPILTDVKSSSAYARTTPLPVNEMSMQGSSRDQLPKVSFEMARSSILAPRRLDSSRSLHEAPVNVSHEGKVFARRSVDTAERAAAAARGALKELSRITTDFTGPSHRQVDQVNIRDVVRSSFGQEQYAPKLSASPSLSSSSTATQSTFATRMANEATPKTGLAKDMSRSQYTEAKSAAECNSAEKSPQSFNTFGRVEAARPPRHYKPKSEGPPTKSCADISESLRLLAQLREAAPAYNSLLGNNVKADNVRNKVHVAANLVPQQARSSLDLTKEGTALTRRVSLPRAPDQIPGRMSSYEPSRASSVESLVQGGPKAREIPRLSLDGRGAGAGLKASEAGSRGRLHSRSLLNSRSVSCSNSDCDTESLNEKRTSFSSNVVAKLMGLDEMPNGEPAQAARFQTKLDLSDSADQKAFRRSNTVMQDTDPTFSQCGKYVSASFFPSKRRDDIKIDMDPEEEEEASYLQLEPLSHQEARTLNVRVGSLKLQAGDRLVTSESANSLGHIPCYQPKNHHLMEDRPPHVLSPAARLCAQIEEMQRADSSYKEVDRGIRNMELQQSSKLDLETLKQLLGAIHLNKDYSHGAGSRMEKLEPRATSRKPQPESVRALYLHEQHTQQAEQPLDVIWKTKRMMNDELDTQTHQQINPIGRRVPLDGHNRRVKNAIHVADSLPSSRQYAENYSQVSRTRADVQSSPASSHPSTYSTPRKPNISNDCITPTNSNTTNMAGARRLATRTHTPPNFVSARFSTSPQTPLSQQLRNNSSCSWEASSVSSTSSGNVRDQQFITNSSQRAADKRNKQCEKGVERKKSGSGILKDKEECKVNLVSSKPSQSTPTDKPTDKRTTFGGGLATARANTRTARRSTPQQNPELLRSGMRSPTKSSARRAEEVKRKLTFSNLTASGVRPSEMASENEDAQCVEKSMVSSIHNEDPSRNYTRMHQSSGASTPVMHEEPFSPSGSPGHQLAFSPNTPNITHFETEVAIQSPLVLFPCEDAEANHVEHLDQHVPTTIYTREPITGDGGSSTVAICTPAGALKLPQQVPQQENEDTESQGDKSTGSCEQPSPISVLDGPFYEEDVSSPPTPTKFVLKLQELEEEARKGKDVSEDSSTGGSAQLFECGLPPPNHEIDVQDSVTADFDYVKQLLEIAGFGTGNMGIWKLRPLEPHCFLQLEEENASFSACKSELGIGSMWRRRLLFDGVNTSLERRLRRWRLCKHQPWLLARELGLRGIVAGDCSPALQQGIIGLDEENNVVLSGEGGEVLLGEVWEEVGVMQRGKRRKSEKAVGSSMGSSACEEEEGCDDDDVGRLLEEDILCGSPDPWGSLHVERGELGLDLERLIFKDLIDHTIRDLGLLIYPPPPIIPSTKRQLFKLHHY